MSHRVVQKAWAFVRVQGLLIVVFVATTLYFRHDGSVNALSRWAALCSLAESGSFSIDGYQGVTIDWALTPDGHYYSNKAPGPVFAAYPLFKVADTIQVGKTTGVLEQRDVRRRHARDNLVLVSFVYQTCFAVILAAAGFFLLPEWGASQVAALFFSAAIFFGATPSLLMNTFFGHAFAALCMVASVLFTLRRSYGWAACAFGWALLSDYGSAMVLFGLVPVWLADRQTSFGRKARAIFVGAVIPGTLWCVYHQLAFGSILTLPTRFQNPRFVDAPASGATLWGTFYPVPRLEIVGKLLVGEERGLLFTQPWVLVVAVVGVVIMMERSAHPWWERAHARAGVIACAGLAALIAMNAAFGGWNGGSTIGPRYLSPILLVFGVWAALIYDRAARIVKGALWIGLGVSVTFYALVLPRTIIGGEGPLWPSFLQRVAHGGDVASREFWFTLAAIGVALWFGSVQARRAPREP